MAIEGTADTTVHITQGDRLDAAPDRAAPKRHIPFGRPMIGAEERRAVLRVLDGPTLTDGPAVRQFERQFAVYTGSDHAVATSSCAAALHLGALALGIGPGDDVLVSAQTHAATAQAVELCGARCVFVDSEPRTGNIDPDLLEASITPRSRAIVLVHYVGVPAAMHRIADIARRNRLSLMEDCALALGASIGGQHVGLFGDAGCFSFYPIKHITTGEGGMLITRHAEVARAAQRARAFGIERTAVREGIPSYDVTAPGWNYRLTEAAAVIGTEQLRKLPDFLRARRDNVQALHAGLAHVEGITVLAGNEPATDCACYCLVLLLDTATPRQRSDFVRYLGRHGIETSIYYPRPVPLMSWYRRRSHASESDYPVAARISDTSVALPVGPHVSLEDVDYIVRTVKDAVSQVNPQCAGSKTRT